MQKRYKSYDFGKGLNPNPDESILRCLGYVVVTLATCAIIVSMSVNNIEHYTLQNKIMSGIAAVTMAYAGLKYIVVIVKKLLSM